jgi:peptidoglycan-N-acetylglucosamine deacetylase
MAQFQLNKFSPFTFPAKHCCGVLLSWDMDAESPYIATDPRNANHLGALSDGVYGVTQGLHHILHLLQHYNLPATFFVPGLTADRHPKCVEQILVAGHEVTHHGYSHKNVMLMTEDEEEEDLVKGIEALKRVTGKMPLGWRSPSYGIRPHTLRLLSKYGFRYDSSLLNDEVPYIMRLPEHDIVQLPINPALDDWQYFNINMFPDITGQVCPVDRVLDIWKAEFEAIYDVGGCFVLTMHPHLTGRPSRIKMLSRLIEHIQSFADVWWATASEIAAHVLNQSQSHAIVRDPLQLAVTETI